MSASVRPITGRIRVALGGWGRISRNHFEASAKIDGLQLVSVADSDLGRAQAAGAEFGVPAFASVEEMLEAVPSHLMTVCTPSGLHPQHGIIAAKAGRHVLTEKPMAISLEAADELVHACDAGGVHLFVAQQDRLKPPLPPPQLGIDQG